MSTQEIELDYEPHPRQQLLHKSTARQILYGGAAGGGKSHSMRWDAYAACLENPGLDAYLFRRTRVELENTHVKRLTELPDALGDYQSKYNRFRFYNGSFLNFCYAEVEKDVQRYNSVEFHWLGIDEAGQFTPYQISYLRSRMRLGAFKPRQPQLFPRCVLSANPGGVSHHFLKTHFIKPAPPETVFYDSTMRNKRNPDDPGWPTVFIPARMDDNPTLDENYASAFGGLPEWQQAALIDGDWDVVAGAYFDCFDKKINVVDDIIPPEYLLHFTAMDGGFASPFWIGWFVVSDGDLRVGDLLLPEGALLLFDEWYGCQRDETGEPSNNGLKMAPEEVARRMRSREGHTKISYRVADPGMWRSDSGPSQAEKMAGAGVSMRKADNERVAGWKQLYSMISGYDQETQVRIPMFYVCRRCEDFIRTITTVQADPNDLDDVLKAGEDHPPDGARYGAMSRHHVIKAPKPKRDILAPVTFNDVIRHNEELMASRSRRRRRI